MCVYVGGWVGWVGGCACQRQECLALANTPHTTRALFGIPFYRLDWSSTVAQAAGVNCTQTCPGTTLSDGTRDLCNAGLGRGVCDTTNFTCRCLAGYLGDSCGLACPRTAGVVCGGNGTCSAANGSAVCTCLSNAAQGFPQVIWMLATANTAP